MSEVQAIARADNVKSHKRIYREYVFARAILPTIVRRANMAAMKPKLTRREAGAIPAAAATLAACFDSKRPLPAAIGAECKPNASSDVDYVVVGSGAGGGPLACNLARAGYRVTLLEAGGDPQSWMREVPALHAQAAEEASMRWDFFVRTYGSDSRPKQDERYVASKNGVLYPRAGTLGGCTAHNAIVCAASAQRRLGCDRRRARRRRAFARRTCANIGSASSTAITRRSRFARVTVITVGFTPDTAHAALTFDDDRLRAIVEAAVGEAAVLNPDLYIDAAKQVLRSGQAL